MLTEITNEILNSLPEDLRMTSSDISTINKNANFITSLSDDIVTMFYNTVFGHDQTKKIFHEGERPIREKSLADWINKTVNGTFDQKYWEWQTFVGILHIKRQVGNNLMITMLGAINQILIKRAILELPPEDSIPLIESWTKLSGLITSLITEGFRIFYLHAIVETTGMSKALLQNTVNTEIDNIIKQNSGARM